LLELFLDEKRIATKKSSGFFKIFQKILLELFLDEKRIATVGADGGNFTDTRRQVRIVP